jgi:hypothetical protein
MGQNKTHCQGEKLCWEGDGVHADIMDEVIINFNSDHDTRRSISSSEGSDCVFLQAKEYQVGNVFHQETISQPR